MRFGLKDESIEKIAGVFAGFPQVEEVIRYGSRAKGNFRTGSDIDLTLKGDLNLDTMNSISRHLDDLMLPYTFDLSIHNHLSNADLLEHISRIGIVFYRK